MGTWQETSKGNLVYILRGVKQAKITAKQYKENFWTIYLYDAFGNPKGRRVAFNEKMKNQKVKELMNMIERKG